MSVEYEVYLRFKEGHNTTIPAEHRCSGGAVVVPEPVASLEDAAAVLFGQNPSLKQTHDPIAFEPYLDFIKAAQQSSMWGSGIDFYYNRSKWLIKRGGAHGHPDKRLTHVDEVFFVEGDPNVDEQRRMTLFLSQGDAMNYAARMFPNKNHSELNTLVGRMAVYVEGV